MIAPLSGMLYYLRFLAFITCAVYGQSALAVEKSDDIDTNRPSFCQSAFVVPAGSIQLENGSLYQHFQHGLTYFDIPENQVRIGLLRKTELQIFTPNMILWNQSRSTFAGTSGLQQVGLKQQFGPYKRLTASLVAGVNLPTGSKLLAPSTCVQPSFSLPYSIQLTKNWALCGMQSLIVTNSQGDLQYQPFLMISRALGARASAFVEYAAYFQQNSQAASTQIAHFGGVYKLNKHHQLDIEFGFGLTNESPSAQVGAGYSYRFDGLPWGNKKKPSTVPFQANPGQNPGADPILH